MAVYLRRNKYYYRRQIGGIDYRVSLGLKRGQERMLSAVVARAEADVFARHEGLERPLSPGRVMFSDFAEHRFLASHTHKKSYADDATQVSIIIETLGDISLGSFGKREVEKLERLLLAKGRSLATVNRYMSLLRHIFNHAAEENLVRENPVKCYVPYIEEPKRRALLDEEIRSVLCAAAAIQAHPASKTQAHIHDIITVALNTGLRLSEILNLRWDYVRDGLIVLPYNQTKSRKRGVGERARAVIIPVNDEVRAVLDAQTPGEYVFDIERGRDHSSVKRTVNQIRRLSGVKEFSMHYLRHTVSTRLAAKVSIAAAKEMLGHANLQTTLRYTHPGLDEKRSGVTNLGTAFREIVDN